MAERVLDGRTGRRALTIIRSTTRCRWSILTIRIPLLHVRALRGPLLMFIRGPPCQINRHSLPLYRWVFIAKCWLSVSRRSEASTLFTILLWPHTSIISGILLGLPMRGVC